ncbi:dethiobiotin synthase [Riemerella anatipestifer]|uniref:dethiobiotin synthase n=1 Tax=Riemerella anatipestifer TaxID=34085 RepID=UPI0006998C89|nr:dethiobiotin synthase [Riemerella anatipestifer]
MKLFVTGIGTEVGKTMISAILVEALGADYWKPIQAGDLDFSDTDKVKNLVTRTDVSFHPNAYTLNTPASPHYSAELDGISINLESMLEPRTDNDLVIEGAGGVMVPINDQDTFLDFIKEDYKVVLVSRNYLGSINHTLMTYEVLKNKGVNFLGIVFNGEANPSTEQIIISKTQLEVIGRVAEEPIWNKETVQKYASIFNANFFKK